MGRSFEQPSPEVCSPPAYVLRNLMGMAPTCHSQLIVSQERARLWLCPGSSVTLETENKQDLRSRLSIF